MSIDTDRPDLEALVRACLDERARAIDAVALVPPHGQVAARVAALRRRRMATRLVAAAAVLLVGVGAAVASGLWRAEPNPSRIPATQVPLVKTAAPTGTVVTFPDRPPAQWREEDPVIRAALAADPALGRRPGDVVGCGFERHGQSPDRSDLYLWAVCGAYAAEGGTAVLQSGWSAPILVHVTGSGSFLSVVGYERPRDGTAYARDVRRLFPEETAESFLHRSDIHADAERAAAADASAQLGLGSFAVIPLGRELSTALGRLVPPGNDGARVSAAGAVGAVPADGVMGAALSAARAGPTPVATDGTVRVLLARRTERLVWVVVVAPVTLVIVGDYGAADPRAEQRPECAVAALVDATTGAFLESATQCPSPF